jgi:DNA-binding MarR family transcriptional regulator
MLRREYRWHAIDWLANIRPEEEFLTQGAPVTGRFDHLSVVASVLTLALGPLDFEHNPGFLVGRLSRRISAELDRRMREHGLTFAQAAVMSRLWWQDGLTQTQLQEQVGVDGSTLTGLLQRMTRQGIVRRRRDGGDGRVMLVYLTQRGRDLLPLLNPEADAANERLFQGFSPAERVTFLALTQRALHNMEAGGR